MSVNETIPSIELGIYEHYKGKRYRVVGTALHTESMEPHVVYQPLYKADINPDFWIRPYAMFIENVMVDGKSVPRFKKVNKDS